MEAKEAERLVAIQKKIDEELAQKKARREQAKKDLAEMMEAAKQKTDSMKLSNQSLTQAKEAQGENYVNI